MAVSANMIDVQEDANQQINALEAKIGLEKDPGRVRSLGHQLLAQVRRLPGCYAATTVRLPSNAAALLSFSAR